MNESLSRPLYEKRAWGEYTVLHHLQCSDGSEALTKHLVIQPGCNISYQYHQHRREVWTIIEGTGLLIIDGRLQEVSVGAVIDIPCGAKHSMRALERLHFIEVQLGSPLIEEDIVRLGTEWNEIEKGVT